MILPIAEIQAEDVRFLFSTDTRLTDDLAAANRSLKRLDESVDDLWPVNGNADLRLEEVKL